MYLWSELTQPLIHLFNMEFGKLKIIISEALTEPDIMALPYFSCVTKCFQGERPYGL